jgi:glycosyltransferase involved in cell wall biosynthesis
LAIYPRLERSNDVSRVGLPRIGVIGRESPEKNTDKLLNFLVEWQESGELAAEIVLGSDDTEVMERWASKGVTTVQTADYQDYLDAVSSVDVLLIYYDRAHYFYRSSGVIHEAAYVGTAVVCPDFPVFRYQVTQPARVGALYQDVEGILQALQSAIEIARSAPDNFEIWSKSRCPEEFSRRIDRFLEGSR